MTLFKWSRTAASNAAADSSINWAEGQPPSSVNDSARATMAAVAKYRDDIAGALLTSGTGTAYALTSYQGFDTLAHMDGAMVAFTPHATNGATVTLNVDGLGAKPLRSAPGTELLAGVLVQGTPYVATYSNADLAWYLHGFFGNPHNIPLGGMLPYIGTTAPNSSFVLPYGQAISRTTYAALFSLISTTFGSGDGSTTFNVPDLRGRTLFGLDNMGGSAALRLTTIGSGTTLGAAGGGETKTVAQANLPNITLTTNITDPGHPHYYLKPGAAGSTTGGGGFALYNAGSPAANANTDVAITGITASTPLGGSGTPLNVLPPTMLVNFILRII